MLRLTIILYETGLRRKRFRFILSPLTINLQMFLLSRFLLLRLLLFSSSFKLIFHPQLERAYYIGNIVVILLCCNFITTIVYCPTYIYIYRQGWLTNRSSLPIILNCCNLIVYPIFEFFKKTKNSKKQQKNTKKYVLDVVISFLGSFPKN